VQPVEHVASSAAQADAQVPSAQTSSVAHAEPQPLPADEQ
jgi:hypothetical protein